MNMVAMCEVRSKEKRPRTKKKIQPKTLNLKPYMCPFGVTQHAGIAFRVGLFQSDFAYAYCV